MEIGTIIIQSIITTLIGYAFGYFSGKRRKRIDKDKDELKELKDTRFQVSMIEFRFANLLKELYSYRENHTLGESIVKIGKVESDMISYYPDQKFLIILIANSIYNSTEIYFYMREKGSN